MTDADRGRLAQIASWGLSRGEPQAEIEARIAEYAPGLEQDDIDQALRSGWAAVLLPDYIHAGNLPDAAAVLEGMREDGATQVRALYRVRIGAGPDDWRSGAVVTSAGTPPQSILDLARQDAAVLVRRIAREGSDPQDPRNVATPINETAEEFGTVELIYVAPL